MLQRRVQIERVPERTECRQGGMRAGLPFDVRPGGRIRQGPGEEQSPSFAQGLQSARQIARARSGRCLFVQDRGPLEEHVVCKEYHQILFRRPGPAGRLGTGKVCPRIFRKGFRGCRSGSVEDLQPRVHRIVPGRKAGALGFDGRTQIDGRIHRNRHQNPPVRQRIPGIDAETRLQRARAA